MKLPKRVVVSSVLAVAFAALFLASNLMAADQASSRYQGAGFALEQAKDGRFTLEAQDASLAEILQQLSRLSGVRIDVDPRLDKKVSRVERAAELTDLLNKLTESQALTFEKDGDAYRLVGAAVTSQADAVIPSSAPEALSAAEAEFLRSRHIVHNAATSLKSLRARGSSAVLLNNAVIDGSAAKDKQVSLDIPEAWRAGADAQTFIVQFTSEITELDKQALAAAGARILHYIPHHAFAVQVEPAAVEQVRALDRVQLVEAFHPYYKLSADLLTEAVGEPNEKARAALESGQLTLMTFQGLDAGEVARVPGVEILKEHTAGQRSALEVRIRDAGVLASLAQASVVQWIEPTARMKPMNDTANKRLRASTVKRRYPGLDGSGVIVNVNDTGVDFVNPGFAQNPSQPTSTNLNTRISYYGFKAGGFTSDGLPGDTEGHGTHVAGSILGNGALSATVISSPGSKGPPYATNQFAGIAPGAKLVMLEDFNSYEHQEMVRTAYTNGARISNNSWGNSVYTYGAMSALWDDFVRDADETAAGNQELITFFAAGNDGDGEDDGLGGTAGTVGQPGNAKNVITVGAVEQARRADNIMGVFFGDTEYNSIEKTDSDWQMANFSSRGPVSATDVRVKPDVVAPGAYVLSVQSHEVLTDEFLGPGYVYDYRYRNVNSGTNFAFFSGTSMATPLAAGSAALIYQSYTNRFNKSPSPALMKAMMVAGARMLNTLIYRYETFGDLPPVVDQGWGLIDVKRSVDGLPVAVSDTNSIVMIDQDETVNLGETKSYTVVVPANQGGLRVVLAWTDPAGNPVNSVQLVNDLDLYVDGPGGSGYLGNFFGQDGINSQVIAPFTEVYVDAFGDAFNNVEVINIPNLTPGSYTIKVRGSNVPQGPQNFALVVMKGMGYEGFTLGNEPDIALDTNGLPVMAYSYDSSIGEGYSNLTRQIFVKRWKGALGDVDDLGQWRRMEDQWYAINNSMEEGLGISRTLENSVDPSIAVNGENIFVAWRERPQNIGGTNISHVFLRHYNGTNWVELANSAQGSGLDGSTAFDAFAPQVAVMGDGNPIVAWLQYNSATLINVRAAKWNGTSWVGLGSSLTTNGLPMSFPAIVNNEAEYLSMAVNHLGNPIVAWHENPAGAAKSTISVRRWTGASWEVINYSNTLFYIDSPKIAASPINGDLYLTWRQQVSGASSFHPHQIFAARRTGASWTEMSGSFTYPGISTAAVSTVNQYPYSPDIALRGSNVMVSWRAGNTNGNYVFVRQWNPSQSGWSSVYGAGDVPGVASWSETAQTPVLVMDKFGLPFVTFDASLGSSTGQSLIATYTIVADREAPEFDGIFSATGTTNNSVVVQWFPATDLSTTVVYQIYRSSTSNSCSSAALACDSTNVFANLIATVTNAVAYTNVALTPGFTWCYGVRAMDTNGFVDANTATRRAGPVGGVGDSDNDCLSNLVELAVGTAPCDPDSDDDGMYDGWEWFYSTNNIAHTNLLAMDPLDNGIINLRNGNPGQPGQLPSDDLDVDGASNLEEYQWYVAYTSQCVTATTNLISPDPTRADTDGDQLPDGWEMVYGLNPVVSNNVSVDTDCDGLSALQEFLNGTDPNNPDTDRDGLYDGTWSATNCLGAASNLFEGTYGTHPLLTDTDFDGLDDGVETQFGFNPIRAASVVSFLTDGDLYQLGWTNSAITNSTSILLQEDFETSTRNNWTTNAPNGAMPFNFWHLSTAEPGVVPTNGVSYFNARSTNTAFRMANDPSATNLLATYDIGGGIQSLIQNALLSPRFTATNASTMFIQWNEYFETEPNADFVTVQARGGTNQNWFSISSVISGYSLNTNPVTGFVTNDWVHRRADLSRFAGQSNVQVRFLFSAQNSINNNYKGWWVDDVAVFGTRTISGWVRDNNGRALEGATVYAIGRGGVKKVLDGQVTIPPGKVFAENQTAQDGSFAIKDVLPGSVYIKALAPGYAAEFYNGQLFTGSYTFAAGLYPGVSDIDLVGTGGYVNVISGNFTQAFFEVERGLGRAYLGVAMDKTAGARYPVYVDGKLATIWNGSNTTALATNTAYLTHTNLNQLINNHPDWETNAVTPRLLTELAPGAHWLQVATNFTPVLPVFPLREGEKFLVDFSTNGASGSVRIEAQDSGSYPVWMDGRMIGNTPLRRFAAVGPHKFTIVSTNFARVALKTVAISPGALNVVIFSNEDLNGVKGSTWVRAQDVFGSEITNAAVYLNGSLYSTNTVLPTLITNLLAGDHYVQVVGAGYRPSEHRPVRILSAASNTFVFTLADADADFDRVGDRTEIIGYTNLYLYSRSDDPDADGLNNLFEFDVFRQVGIRLNPFDADSDDDGMSDGAEVGYDGLADRVAISTIAEVAVQGTNTLRSYFVGQYLGGVDNFGTGGITVASIDCDRFEANSLGHSNDVMPSKNQALTVFRTIPQFGAPYAISVGHFKGSVILGDTRPDVKDTDGDSMWDGFEHTYAYINNILNPGTSNRIMDPLECSDPNADPDADGLSNYEEFLGTDRAATTNLDWTDPTKADSDGDGMPDGWEYFYGLDPRNAGDKYLDPDGDGLVNVGEFNLGSNPRMYDTDLDGLPDGQEALFGTDPQDVDTDNDGLIDGREAWDKNLDGIPDGGFFPNWFAGADMDNDGYTDGPTDWDTDGDGMPDGWEVLDSFGRLRPVALDPSDASDADEDYDGDGLSNLQEYLVQDALYGNHPSEFSSDPIYGSVIWDYGTDPFNPDTDGDGMPDGWEVIHGLHPMDPIPDFRGGGATNLSRYSGILYELGYQGDADRDGLWNRREFRQRFAADPNSDPLAPLEKSTHPWIADTDKDGLGDGEEDRSFRANPVVQDSDKDRLMDGSSVEGRFGEVESSARVSDYLVVACATCTWADAETMAQAPYPANPSVRGHLVTVEDANEQLLVTTLLTPAMTNIAIGGYLSDQIRQFVDTNLFEYVWVDGSAFIYTNWVTGQPTAYTGEWYMAMANDGTWTTVTPTSVLDHFVVEWDSVIPKETNHFDQALNDLWMLDWDGISSRPIFHWQKITPTNTPPAPRWGAAASYVPVFERELVPKYGFDRIGRPVGSIVREGNPILDNRQLVVLGGRDGVTKFSDVWQYLVVSNTWIQGVSIPYGTHSEFSAFTLFGYEKGPSGCDFPNPGFLSPKVRPWWTVQGDDTEGCPDPNYWFGSYANGARLTGDCGTHPNDPFPHISYSYDYTAIFGGWDANYTYWSEHPSVFKARDNALPQIDILLNAIDATELNLTKTDANGTTTDRTVKQSSSNNVATLYLGRPLITTNVVVTIENAVTTRVTEVTEYLGINGIYFGGLKNLGQCENLSAVYLDITLGSTASTDITVDAFAEFDKNTGRAFSDYFTWLPSERFTNINSRFFNSTHTNIFIPSGTPAGTVFSIDLTAILAEVNDSGNFGGDELGFILHTPTAVLGDVVTIDGLSTALRVSYTPGYAEDSIWKPINGTASNIKPPAYKSQDEAGCIGNTRDGIKSPATAYAYDGLVNGSSNPVVVTFGGMNGLSVLKETMLGTPSWVGSSDHGDKNNGNRNWALNSIAWSQPACSTEVTTPSARWGASMVYDEGSRVVVLFGGFDDQHRPLNDVWVFDGAQWSEVRTFSDNERPQPRGGASMIYYGGADYERGWDEDYNPATLGCVVFGGTDGKVYFDDLWLLRPDAGGWRWMLCQPEGEQFEAKPSPRAFASFSYAQNGAGENGWDKDTNPKHPGPGSVGILFGGRSGPLLTSRDTDKDMVDDGQEYELGGPSAGRDPRVNRLVQPLATNETIPFAYMRMGPVRDVFEEANRVVNGAWANMEALVYDCANVKYIENLIRYQFPWQGYNLEQGPCVSYPYFDAPPWKVGVDGYRNDMVELWYHQFSLEFPYDVRDEWQLGRPVPDNLPPNGAPTYAYSGRWCYGTDLDGNYPDNAQMELLSPLMQLTIPATNSTAPNYTTRFNLVFHEWLDLADSNDIVRVEMIRPVTGSEIVKRIPNPAKPIITLVPNRSSAYNTTGSWRRVIVPIEVSANETNIFFKFFFRSDASGNAGGWYIDDVAVIQGGEINGTYTNGTNAQVVLLGTNYNGHVQDQTTAYGAGDFQFGLLPAGNYMVGANGVVTNIVVGPGSPSVFLGINDLPSVSWSLIALPPTLVQWNAVPGFVYRVDYSTDFGANWFELVTQPATGLIESFLDTSGDPFRWYRVILLGTP